MREEEVMYRIMVVDDNPSIVENLRLLLECENFEVEAYTDPLEALERLKCGGFDLVITDIRMPRLSGFELLEEARKVNPRLRSIIISGHYDDTSPIDAMLVKRYCDTAIAKPFSLVRLMHDVMLLLGDPAGAAA